MSTERERERELLFKRETEHLCLRQLILSNTQPLTVSTIAFGLGLPRALFPSLSLFYGLDPRDTVSLVKRLPFEYACLEASVLT